MQEFAAGTFSGALLVSVVSLVVLQRAMLASAFRKLHCILQAMLDDTTGAGGKDDTCGLHGDARARSSEPSASDCSNATNGGSVQGANLLCSLHDAVIDSCVHCFLVAAPFLPKCVTSGTLHSNQHADWQIHSHHKPLL